MNYGARQPFAVEQRETTSGGESRQSARTAWSDPVVTALGVFAVLRVASVAEYRVNSGLGALAAVKIDVCELAWELVNGKGVRL